MADGTEPIALVTGAAHGIGLEVCRQLAERGWTVVLTARGLDRAREAAAALGRSAARSTLGRSTSRWTRARAPWPPTWAGPWAGWTC